MGHLSDVRSMQDFIVLDTETSGLERDGGVVIQLSITDSAGASLFTTLCQLPNGRHMNPKAEAVHGISEEAVKKDGLPWLDVYLKLMFRLNEAKNAGKRLVIYNAPFDTAMIIATCNAHGVSSVAFKQLIAAWPPVDAMLAYSEYRRDWNDYRHNWRWFKLTEACSDLMIEIANAHDASGDCLMTAKVCDFLKSCDVSNILDAAGEPIYP